MSLLVLRQYLLGTVVLLVNHLQHLLVHDLRRRFRIRLLERVILMVIEVDVGQFVAHASVRHHGVCLLCGALQVVHGPRRDVADKQFFGSTAT